MEAARKMSNHFRKMSMPVSERPPPTPVFCNLPNCPHRQSGTNYHTHPVTEGHSSTPLSEPEPTRRGTAGNVKGTPGKSRGRALTRVLRGARNLVRRLTVGSRPTIGDPTNSKHLHHEERFPRLGQVQTLRVTNPDPVNTGLSRSNAVIGRRVKKPEKKQAAKGGKRV